MGKSVYSMVLDDEVVKCVDMAAAKTGESRSQFINRVIAKEVGFATSRQRLDDIIDAIDVCLATHEKIRMVRRQKAAVDFLSALNYKYSPRITYSVDLYPEEKRAKVTIALRTTSPELTALCSKFFGIISKLEESYFGKQLFGVEDGKVVRMMTLPKDVDTLEAARIITRYVNYFDKLMNDYISTKDEETKLNNLVADFEKYKDEIPL